MDLDAEENIDEEPPIANGEVINPGKSKPTLKKTPEAVEKPAPETIEMVNGWRRPKNFKRPVAHKKPTPRGKTQDKKKQDSNEKPVAKPKDEVRLGECEDWTEYT